MGHSGVDAQKEAQDEPGKKRDDEVKGDIDQTRDQSQAESHAFKLTRKGGVTAERECRNRSHGLRRGNGTRRKRRWRRRTWIGGGHGEPPYARKGPGSRQSFSDLLTISPRFRLITLAHKFKSHSRKVLILITLLCSRAL